MMKNVSEEIRQELEKKGITPNGVYPQAVLKEKYCEISDTLLKAIYSPEEGEKLRVHHLQRRMEELVERSSLSDNPICKENQKNINELASKIAATAAGAYGEKKAGEALRRIYSDHYILHNLYLKNEAGAAEYDYIVITSKGIFIVEVKHSNWDIVIEENGDYLRNDNGSFDFHYNIADSMERKRYILWKALPEDIKSSVCIEHIHQLVVFVGDKRVINKVRWLKTCYCNRASRCIDDWYVEKYRLFRGEMKCVFDFLNNNNSEAYFPLDINLEKMITDFSSTLDLIDKAEKGYDNNQCLEVDGDITDSIKSEENKSIIVDTSKSKRLISVSNVTVAVATIIVVAQIPKVIKALGKYFDKKI